MNNRHTFRTPKMAVISFSPRNSFKIQLFSRAATDWLKSVGNLLGTTSRFERTTSVYDNGRKLNCYFNLENLTCKLNCLARIYLIHLKL